MVLACSIDSNTSRLHDFAMIGVTGSLAGRVRKHHLDKYGRWIQVELLGRDGRMINIMCAYQVVQEKGEHGACTTYSQQVQMMRLDGVNDPDPRKAFIRDIKELVKQLTTANQDIILMGDFNESKWSQTGGIGKCHIGRPIDRGLLLQTRPWQRKPRYARGIKRVDYILVSQCLTNHIRATGAEPFNFRIFSDHCGLFVDFAVPGFFDRAPNVLAKQSTRHLIYDCPHHVQKYPLSSSQYLHDHQVPACLDTLLEGDWNDAAADSSDRDITQSMLGCSDMQVQHPSPIIIVALKIVIFVGIF